jgi:predicted flavoprotein YhiN
MFENLGVKTKTERGKRVFPESDKAHDVANALEKQIRNKKVDIILNAKVDKNDSTGLITASIPV